MYGTVGRVRTLNTRPDAQTDAHRARRFVVETACTLSPTLAFARNSSWSEYLFWNNILLPTIKIPWNIPVECGIFQWNISVAAASHRCVFPSRVFPYVYFWARNRGVRPCPAGRNKGVRPLQGLSVAGESLLKYSTRDTERNMYLSSPETNRSEAVAPRAPCRVAFARCPRNVPRTSDVAVRAPHRVRE